MTAAARLSALVALLADGQFHSGDSIGQAAGVSRAAIWKLVEQLRALGLPIEAVRGRGYRLAEAVELLCAKTIAAELAGQYSQPLAVDVLFQCDSTNRVLMEKAKAGGDRQLLLTEIQTAGRGRWGRSWIAPFGSTLCLSLLWRFPILPHGLAGLSLAIAVGAAEALRQMGAPIQLKWPNDLLLDGRKLGGILVELYGEVNGPCAVVIGLGVNLSAVEEISAVAEYPVAGLDEALAKPSSQRNRIAAHLAAAMALSCERFSTEGFQPFMSQWNSLDLLAGEPVILALPREEVHGVARGVDSQGALLLERDGQLESRYSGDLRLRLRRASTA